MFERKQREMHRTWSCPNIELYTDSGLGKCDQCKEVRALGSFCLRKDGCEGL